MEYCYGYTMKKKFKPLYLLALTPVLIVYWLIIIIIVFSLINDKRSQTAAKNNLHSIISDAGLQPKEADCTYSSYDYFWGERVGSNYTMYFLNPENTSYSLLSTAILRNGFASTSYEGNISADFRTTSTKQNLSGPQADITTEIFQSGESVHLNDKCSGDLGGSYYKVPPGKELLEITYSLD